ncbi:MAG: hypothetical protein AB1442_11075, partial [Nitrospirota bacterium]
YLISLEKEEIMKRIFVLFVVLGLMFPVASCAAPGQGPAYFDKSSDYGRGDFYERIERQQKRIKQGIRSGELTREEAATLQDNLNWIKNKYARMKKDDILTRNEQERLDSMLDRNSAMIKSKKHDPIRRLYDADVEERMDNQHRRIGRGITSGELTRREADILQDNLDEVRRRYSKMRRDNALTIGELEKLDRMLDENSKMIYRKEHNWNYDIRRIY